MHNSEEIKKRFLEHNLPTRLGCIAANLARVQSFARMPNNRKVLNDLIEESKFFIEWAAPEASLNIKAELVNTQIQLALWNYSKNKTQISDKAGRLAQKILKLSGLV